MTAASGEKSNTRAEPERASLPGGVSVTSALTSASSSWSESSTSCTGGNRPPLGVPQEFQSFQIQEQPPKYHPEYPKNGMGEPRWGRCERWTWPPCPA